MSSLVDLGARGNLLEDVAVSAMADLFDGLPHVMFCIKDTSGRYVVVNQAFADRAQRSAPSDVIGLRASALFPPDLAGSYEAQDRHVMTTGSTVRSALEVVLRPDGARGWYVTNKMPLRDARGHVTGVASLSIDLRTTDEGRGQITPLATVLDVVRARYAEPLTVEAMARAGGLTVLQLERRMRRVLGVSPKQYLLRVRLEEAMRLLSTTTLRISDIAVRCGYYDQSALTRHFRTAVGVTPGRYRALWPARDTA